MSFTLPALPYAKNALAPFISEECLDYHHGKHHNAYVNNLNNLVKGTEYENASLEEIIKKSYEKKQQAIFNNSAQIFNHTLFFNCLKANGGGEPKGELAEKINQDFGSFTAFRDQFKQAAATHFGSGWAFLTYSPATQKLAVEGHHDASTPFVNGTIPIFTIDVWEHAYYIDYRNARPNFIDTVLDKLANWDFAEENFKAAQQKASL
eukprot:UN00988